MAVKGNTNFTDFKSSKNKISGGSCNVFLSDCYYTIQQDHRPHLTFEEKTSNKTQAGSNLHSLSRHLPAEAMFHTEK